MANNTWRFLVVDDQQAEEIAEFLAKNRILGETNVVMVEPCQRFDDALEILDEKRFDLVILDLKDESKKLDNDNDPLPGELIFEQIKKIRFIPIIFYTALPEHVGLSENPYVRVVARGRDRELIQAITSIFTTKLPQLLRHIENEQKEYMWNHVAMNWKNPISEYENTDLSYLLARRLANTLERNSIRRFLDEQPEAGPKEDDEKIHPVEMYIFPPTDNGYLTGDIFREKLNDSTEEFRYWILLTPSCDFVQGNAEKVLLAECILLKQFPQFVDIQGYWEELKKARDEKSGREPKQTPVKTLTQLLKDNNEVQPERFKFLPGTFFLPNLVVDFQALVQIPLESVTNFERIASLDNPFAEAVLAKFSRYYGRLGTPDLDVKYVIERLFKEWEKEQNS